MQSTSGVKSKFGQHARITVGTRVMLVGDKALRCFMAIALAALMVPLVSLAAWASNRQTTGVTIVADGAPKTVDGVDYFAPSASGGTLSFTVSVPESYFDQGRTTPSLDMTGTEAGASVSGEWAPTMDAKARTKAVMFSEGSGYAFSVKVYEDDGTEQKIDHRNTAIDSNGAPLSSATFAVDATLPTVEVQFPQAVGKMNDVAYFNAGSKVTIAVTETNFNKDKSVVTDGTGASLPCTWSQEPGDAAQWRAEVAMPADNAALQHFEVKAADYAGNEQSLVSDSFVVSSSVPTAAVEIAPVDGVQPVMVSGTAYFQTAPSLTLVTTNADPASASPVCTIGGTAVSLDTSKWVNDANDKNRWTYDLGQIQAEQVSAVSFTVTTIAGQLTTNEMAMGAKTVAAFTVDADPPHIGIALPTNADGVENCFKGDDAGKVTVNVAVADPHFDPANSSAALENTVTGSSTTLDNWAGNSLAVDVTEDGTYAVEVTACDLAGNTATKTSSTFTVDNTKPAVTFKFSRSLGSHFNLIDFFNGEGRLFIYVDDANFDPSRTKVMQVVDGSESLVDGLAWSYDSTEGKYRTSVLCNKYEVLYGFKVSACDKAGNVTACDYRDVPRYDGEDQLLHGLELMLDMTPPSIDISFDAASHESEGVTYFMADENGKVTATITVSDNYLDPRSDEGKPTVELTGTSPCSEIAWTYSAAKKAWTGTCSFEEGAGNKIAVTAYDLATNQAKKASETFVVDDTDPEITAVTFDQPKENTAENADFFGSLAEGYALTAKVTVKDSNFNPEDSFVQANNTTSGVGQSFGGPGHSEFWTQENDGVWSALVPLTDAFGDGKDGSYTLQVHAVDLSLRSAEASYGDVNIDGLPRWFAQPSGSSADAASVLTSGSFIVDTTKPEIALKLATGAEWKSHLLDKDYYQLSGDSALMQIIVKDAHFNPAATTVQTLNAAIDTAGSWKEFSTGTWQQDPDGTWTLYVPYRENAAATFSSIRVTAHDWANNEEEVVYTSKEGWKGTYFVLDATAPQVSIHMSNECVGNASSADGQGKTDFFNSREEGTLTATVTVTDANFDPENRKDGATLSSVVLVDETGAEIGSDHWSSKREGGVVTWTTQVDYREDGVDHALAVVASDLAGNKTEYRYGDATVLDGEGQAVCSTTCAGGTIAGSHFTIDTSMPVVSLGFAPGHVASHEGVDYFDENPLVTVTVVDYNFDERNEGSVVVDQNGVQRTTSAWTKGGQPDEKGRYTWVATVETQEGNDQALTVTAYDKAGNRTEYRYGSQEGAGYNYLPTTTSIGDCGSHDEAGELTGSAFTIDMTAPTIRFQTDETLANAVGGVDYFNDLEDGNGAVAVNVSVTDATFNVVAGETQTKLDPANGIAGAWSEPTDNGDGTFTWTATVVYDATEATNFKNEGCQLSIDAYDWAGNSTAYSYGGGEATSDRTDAKLSGESFTLDTQAPQIASATTDKKLVNDSYIADDGSPYHFYNVETRMSIVVTDNVGLDKVNLENYLGTVSREESGKAVVAIELKDGKEFDRAVKLTTSDLAQNERTWSIYPDGTVVDASGSDAGNTSINGEKVYPQSVIQDTVNPVLAFSGVAPGSYYNTTQTVRLDVTELNYRYLTVFDPSQTVMTVKSVAGNSSGDTSLSTRPVSGFQEIDRLGGTYFSTVDFATDGHYSLDAQVTDPAGNVGRASLGEFTIDKTAPTIEVAFDNNSALNGKYYKAGRTATIVVTEHNFDSSLFNIQTNGAVGGWSSDGDRHTITVGFMSDGTYNLSVSGQDKAGNAMVPYAADEFVVDLTNPTITFEGDIQDGTAHNDTVSPVIAFADSANFDPSSISFTLVGNKVGQVDYESAQALGDNSATVTFADFMRKNSVDDLYTLTAKVSDLAGNEYSTSMVFSVNRFGSNYVVEAPQAKGGNAAGLGYLDAAPRIVVREINVDLVEESTVSSTYNLKTTNLQRRDREGVAGYTVSDGSSEHGWKEYVYTVAPESFEGDNTDGSYTVIVSSKDGAGNTNTSASHWDGNENQASAAVDFTLDTTAPEILGLNVEEGGTYDAPGQYEVSFTATDNIGFDAEQGVQVRVAGHDVDYRTEGNGMVRFDVPERPFTFQPMDIVVTDYAGNKTTSSMGQGIKVTSNMFDLYGVYIAVGAALAAAAIGTGAFMVVRRRKGATATK